MAINIGAYAAIYTVRQVGAWWLVIRLDTDRKEGVFHARTREDAMTAAKKLAGWQGIIL